jgi:uncharacterized protein
MSDDWEWIVQPTDVEYHDAPGGPGRLGGITIRTGPESDWFCDPRARTATENAPIALLPPHPLPFTVTLRAGVELSATFDAAALYVWYDERHWIKFALERSPDGSPTIVSVRTDEWSDDCNHSTVADEPLWLRASLDLRGVALHASADTSTWQLIRLCPHPSDVRPRVGVSVQSPTGQGTVASFHQISVHPGVVADVRDGS